MYETISEGWAIISSFCSFGSTGFGSVLSKTCIVIALFAGRVNMLAICKNNPFLFWTFTEENPWSQKGKTVQWIVQFRTRNREHSWELLPLLVQNDLCHFHCCYKFSVRTGAVYFSDLGCHLLLGGEDFGISLWATKVLPEQPQSCATSCSLQFSFSFLHSVLILMNIFISEVLLFFICLSFCILWYF